MSTGVLKCSLCKIFGPQIFLSYPNSSSVSSVLDEIFHLDTQTQKMFLNSHLLQSAENGLASPEKDVWGSQNQVSESNITGTQIWGLISIESRGHQSIRLFIMIVALIVFTYKYKMFQKYKKCIKNNIMNTQALKSLIKK